MKFWNKLLSKLSSLFKDGIDHMWSATRFSFILTVVISNLAFWGVWCGISLHKGALQTIPESLITVYCLANSIVVTSKLIQKKQENKE